MAYRVRISPYQIGPKTRYTGTVTWSIRDRQGTAVACAASHPLNGIGESTCELAGASLLASEAPYHVRVSYSGDTNFAPSSTTTSLDVSLGLTRVRVSVTPPTSGGAATATATVHGAGQAAVTGYVRFEAVTTNHSVPTICDGGVQQPVVDGTATCVLPPGWLNVSARSPGRGGLTHTMWWVEAQYEGGAVGNFASAVSDVHGHVSSPAPGVVAPTPGGTLQSTTVTIARAGAVTFSGSKLRFKAEVRPFVTTSGEPIAGTVTWTITDVQGATIPCTSSKPLDERGVASCALDSSRVVASNAPLTVTAAYDGDPYFGPSSTSVPVPVALGVTHDKIELAPPASGASTTVSVVVTSEGDAPVTGYVQVLAATTNHSVNAECEGGPQRQLVDGTATCILPAGWLVVSPRSPGTRGGMVTHWWITAHYEGGAVGNFASSQALAHGRVPRGR